MVKSLKKKVKDKKKVEEGIPDTKYPVTLDLLVELIYSSFFRFTCKFPCRPLLQVQGRGQAHPEFLRNQFRRP